MGSIAVEAGRPTSSAGQAGRNPRQVIESENALTGPQRFA
jgi:hypothetical protein